MASQETAGTECPVCREEYKTPKLLPCAHILCLDCLLSWLRDRGCQATCPLCRELILPTATATATDLGNNDFDLAVDALPTDHAAAAVAEGHRVLKGCDVCGACGDSNGNGQVASSFCFHCSMKLCQQCTTAHSKFPAFKRHVTEHLSVLTPERLAVAGQVTCRSHADRSADLYCHAHREVICTLCVPRHAECGDVAILSDYATEERRCLESQAHRLLECGAAMAERIKRLEEERDCGQNMFSALSKDVKEKFDDLQATLEQRRRELNDVIRSQRSDFLQLKASHLTPLKELTPLVTSHGHAALRLAGSAPDGKLVDTLNALNARLNDLEAKARSTETDVATSRTRDSTPPENQPPRRSERATDGVDLSTDESVVLDGSAVSRAKSDIFSIRLIPDTAATRRLDPLRDSENAGGGRAFDPAPLPDAALNAAGVISFRDYPLMNTANAGDDRGFDPTPSPDTSPKAVDVNYFREYPSQDSTNDAGVGNFDTTPPADAASKTADGISSRVYSSPQSTGSEKTVPVDDLTHSTHVALTVGGVSQDTAAAENEARIDVSAAAPDVTTVVGKESRDRAAEGNPGPDGAILQWSLQDMAIIISVGSRVTRGREWSFFNEDLDGGPGGRGRVLRVGRGSHRFGRGWVLVEWAATGRLKWHRMGAEGCYDLELV